MDSGEGYKHSDRSTYHVMYAFDSFNRSIVQALLLSNTDDKIKA